MIRAVGFDLGDTLIEYEGVPLSWQREYPTALAAIASLWDGELSPAELTAGSETLSRFNTRVVPRSREVDHRVVFGDVLRSLGIDDSDVESLVDSAAEAFFGVFQRRARAFSDATAVVDSLEAAGVPVGVLTDVPYGMPKCLALADLERAGLERLTPRTLTSVEVGMRKPAARGFEMLAGLLGFETRDMLFVGNEEKDIAGGLAAGMTAILVWRLDGIAPDWGQHCTVASLDEVLAAYSFEQVR